MISSTDTRIRAAQLANLFADSVDASPAHAFAPALVNFDTSGTPSRMSFRQIVDIDEIQALIDRYHADFNLKTRAKAV